MFWLIVVLVFICSLSGSSGDTQQHQTPKRLSGSEKKRIKRMKKDIEKAREKAKMDEWEDMMSIAVAFMDD